MAAIFAQEGNVGEAVEPVRVVDHDGIGRPLTEGQIFLENASDAGDVGIDFRIGDELALRVLARGIADLRRAAAHQRSEEHTSELQSLMRISYAVFCLKK